MAVESLDELDVAVADLVYKATGVRKMIKSYPDRSPPEDLYGTYNIIPVRAYGQARHAREDYQGDDSDFVDIREVTVTQLEVMASLNFFNEGARNAAHRMIGSQFREVVANHCRVNGLGWRYVSDARNLTGLEMATLQERYQIDLHMWVQTSISDIILRAAGFSVEVYNEDEQLLTRMDGAV